MKKSAVLFIVLLFAQNLFALPVVFKTTKDIKKSSEAFTEIATVSIGNLKYIRIGAVLTSGAIEKPAGSEIKVELVEDESVFYHDTFNIFKLGEGRTVEYKNLSSKIKISAVESGTYKIIIWGGE